MITTCDKCVSAFTASVQEVEAFGNVCPKCREARPGGVAVRPTTELLDAMLDADKALYEKILDTPGEARLRSAMMPFRVPRNWRCIETLDRDPSREEAETYLLWLRLEVQTCQAYLAGLSFEDPPAAPKKAKRPD